MQVDGIWFASQGGGKESFWEETEEESAAKAWYANENRSHCEENLQVCYREKNLQDLPGYFTEKEDAGFQSHVEADQETQGWGW